MKNLVFGVLLSLHKEEPFQFVALGFINDMNCARETVRKFCVDVITIKLKNDDTYTIENLTDDEQEALAYFGLK